MNTIKTISNVNETELKFGIVDSKGSWHNKYKNSCWIYVGGLKFEYSEGDVLCIFSQYGEIVNINMIRDRYTGKSKGFCFICYEDQRSTTLAVDNFNGIKIGGRTLRVDHVEDYKLPSLFKDENDILKKFLYENGCGPENDTQIKELQEESDKIKVILDKEVDSYELRKKEREERSKIIRDDKHVNRNRSSPDNNHRSYRHRSRDRNSRSRSRDRHSRTHRRSRSSHNRQGNKKRS